MSDDLKLVVLKLVAAGRPIAKIQRSLYQVGECRVHVRACSADRRRPSHFKFGINDATLRADQELWICGGPSLHFLLPTGVVRSMYNDPSAYIDRLHPDICIASVDIGRSFAKYARGKDPIDLRAFRGRTLEPVAA